jgi:hypothetical protein
MSFNQEGKIKDVWEENMIDELRKISELIEHYNYVSMVYMYNLGYRVSRHSLPS